MPAAKSRYSFPCASYSLQPWPLVSTMLGREYVCSTYLQRAVHSHTNALVAGQLVRISLGWGEGRGILSLLCDNRRRECIGIGHRPLGRWPSRSHGRGDQETTL